MQLLFSPNTRYAKHSRHWGPDQQKSVPRTQPQMAVLLSAGQIQVIMKNYLHLLILSCALWIAACDDPSNRSAAPSSLLNCWTHSYEEETQQGTELFRPCDYKEFGPSHYRQRMILKEDNQASYLQLSPVDAHTMVDGTWQYNNQTKTLRILDSTGMEFRNYIVERITADQLVLRQNPG